MTRLLQISDTHIYASPSARMASLDTRESFLKTLNAALTAQFELDALLLTGDLAMDGSAEAYAFLDEALAGLEVPVYAVPGNHDDPALMHEVLTSVNVLPPAPLSFASWRVVLLSSWVDGEEGGALDEQAFVRLNQAFSDGPEHVLVVLHHPLFEIASAWMDEMAVSNRARFWHDYGSHPALRAVVCGHVHQNFDAFQNGIRLLATPSTCLQFAPRSASFELDARAPGYRELTLHDDGRLDTRVMRLSA
ncbi:MAG: metallophosphoesterase [Pseudomonadota bacterium]